MAAAINKKLLKETDNKIPMLFSPTLLLQSEYEYQFLSEQVKTKIESIDALKAPFLLIDDMEVLGVNE